MADPFPILDVTGWPAAGDEAMGSKPKVWLEAVNGVKWLFKQRHRTHTGDDWAEKVAAEVAAVIDIPHATVELAHRGVSRGIISRDLVGELGGTELVLGNSLLVEDDPDYPRANRFHVAEHTLDRVFAVLRQSFIGLPATAPADPALKTAPDLFISYLMLDALVGNTDRHHENWAVLQFNSGGAGRAAVLCPSFDHASCLGHNLGDDERDKRLTTRDQGYTVAAYVRKARSALYRNESDRKPLSPLDAFRAAAGQYPAAARFWLTKLAAVDPGRLTDIVGRVPNAIMTDIARQFTCEILTHNHTNLLADEFP